MLDNEKCFLVLLVYVHDVLITGTSEDDITKVKTYLHKLFIINDIGYAKYFLGLGITRSLESTFVNQRKHTLDIIKMQG